MNKVICIRKDDRLYKDSVIRRWLFDLAGFMPDVIMKERNSNKKVELIQEYFIQAVTSGKLKIDTDGFVAGNDLQEYERVYLGYSQCKKLDKHLGAVVGVGVKYSIKKVTEVLIRVTGTDVSEGGLFQLSSIGKLKTSRNSYYQESDRGVYDESLVVRTERERGRDGRHIDHLEWVEYSDLCEFVSTLNVNNDDGQNNLDSTKKEKINLLGNHDLQEKFIIKEICRRGLNPLEKLVKNEKASIKRYFENVHDISGGTFEKAWDRLKEKNIIFINPY